jgi:anti-sigma B factor antagonist
MADGPARWAASAADATNLAIEVGRDAEAYTLILHGSLDLSTTARLEAAVEAALASEAERIRLDFDGLEFIDSTGLAAVLRIKRRSDHDGRLRMTRGTGEVAQMFRLTALDMVLPFE